LVGEKQEGDPEEERKKGAYTKERTEKRVENAKVEEERRDA